MIFEPLPLEGAWRIRPEKATDDRGYFARILCVKEFATHGLIGNFVQASVSHNRRRGTVRGVHFQWPPSREAKLVRCIQGVIHDVLVDLRPDSPTFLKHASAVLDPAQGDALYIPSGFGHGFQALADDSVIQYHMTDEFRPDLADGLRWDDPALGLALPLPVSTIAARDLAYAPFQPDAYAARYRGSLAATLS